MGGNVSVILKKENGEQVNMDRWTNIMPYYLSHADLYTGHKEKWQEAFLKEWLLMKEDYEENKKDQNFKYNMTSVYFPFDNFAPSEYGMIVIDLQKNTIYSSQGYCSIGNINMYSLAKKRNNEYEENVMNFKKMWEAGFINKIESYDIKTNGSLTVDISSLSFSEVLNIINEIEEGVMGVGKVPSNPLFKDLDVDVSFFDLYFMKFVISSDWKFYQYRDGPVELLKLRQKLKEDGFVFTDDDNKEWMKYLESYSEYEFKELYNQEFPDAKTPKMK